MVNTIRFECKDCEESFEDRKKAMDHVIKDTGLLWAYLVHITNSVEFALNNRLKIVYETDFTLEKQEKLEELEDN